MDKNSFILYTDYFEQIQMLDLKQRGVLLTALMVYQLGEELPEMDPVTKMAYLFISADMRRNNEKYEQIVEQRREAGRKGGYQKQANLANVANASFARNARNENVANQANLAKASDNDNETDTDNETEKENDDVDETDTDTDNERLPAGSAGLESENNNPSFKQVADEVAEQGYKVSARKFFDYYERQHWMTSTGEPVRNWKSMLKVWDMKERGTSPVAIALNGKPRSKNRFNNFDQRTYNEDDLEGMLVETEV